MGGAILLIWKGLFCGSRDLPSQGVYMQDWKVLSSSGSKRATKVFMDYQMNRIELPEKYAGGRTKFGGVFKYLTFGLTKTQPDENSVSKS